MEDLKDSVQGRELVFCQLRGGLSGQGWADRPAEEGGPSGRVGADCPAEGDGPSGRGGRTVRPRWADRPAEEYRFKQPKRNVSGKVEEVTGGLSGHKGRTVRRSSDLWDMFLDGFWGSLDL